MVAFARQTANDAHAAPRRAQVAALRAHGYTDAEIFDIAATAAGRAFFAKLLDALGVLPDSAFLALDESFRRALTVGRPIDESERVMMPVLTAAADGAMARPGVQAHGVVTSFGA